MPGTVRIVIGSLMVCLACAVATSDEPQLKREAPPEAEKAGATPPEGKQADEKEEKEKAKAPAGDEDAPVAGDPRRPLNGPPVMLVVQPEDVAAVGEEFAQILAAPVGDDVLSVEKQFRPHFTRLVIPELSFINRTCDLNLEQRQKIKAASDKCLDAAVRKYAMAQRGTTAGRTGRTRPVVLDPNELLHATLATVLKDTLRPDQQAAYDGELTKRAAYRQQVVIDNLIAILDERLSLTLDQRQQLAESLDKNWLSDWVQSLEMLMNTNQYVPSIPDQIVVPALNETQAQVWRSLQKRSFMTFGLGHWGEQAAVLDDFPLVEIEAVIERESGN